MPSSPDGGKAGHTELAAPEAVARQVKACTEPHRITVNPIEGRVSRFSGSLFFLGSRVHPQACA